MTSDLVEPGGKGGFRALVGEPKPREFFDNAHPQVARQFFGETYIATTSIEVTEQWIGKTRVNRIERHLLACLCTGDEHGKICRWLGIYVTLYPGSVGSKGSYHRLTRGFARQPHHDSVHCSVESTGPVSSHDMRTGDGGSTPIALKSGSLVCRLRSAGD